MVNGSRDDLMEHQVRQDMEPCWPFWGHLFVFETPSDFEPELRHFMVMRVPPSVDVFKRFDAIWKQALQMLEGRKIDELRTAASEIRSAIDDWVDNEIETETEKLVQQLCQQGGFQLSYLHEESDGTEEQIRVLLDNWPSTRPDSGLPQREQFSDLDALWHYFEENEFDKSKVACLGLVGSSEYEFYAVLALMTICQTFEPSRWDSSKSGSLSHLVKIGQATIQAVEVIAFAEQMQFKEKLEDATASAQSSLLKVEIERLTREQDEKLRRASSEAGRKGAKAKNADTDRLKKWALQRAASMRGSDREIARMLSATLPIDLADVSKDPDRLIYEALRELRKKNVVRLAGRT